MPRKTNVPVSPARKEGKPMAANENEKKFNRIRVRDAEKNEYTLEFNARVIKNMERRGFKLDSDFPYTMVDDLFLGAFQMHHKGISPERAKEIWNAQSKKDELLGALTKLYTMPFEELMAEPENGGDDGNPTWETA